MSFLVKAPNLSAAASAQQQVASYKEAESVPFGYGSAMLPAHWISDSFNWREVGAGSGKPSYQYCSIAFALGEGPIDYVGLMKQDGKPMWNFDYWFADGEDYHDFTINPSMSGGLAWTCRIYRGSESQLADSTLSNGTGQDHPAYRGTAYVVMQNIDLGMGNTSLPTFSIETGRNPPQIGDGVLSGDAGGYGANPFAAIYGMLLNASAGDFDPTLLDESHWAAQVNALCVTGVQTRSGERVFLHPWFRQATRLGDALSQILAYVDGYVYASGGKLRVGWFPGGSPPSELPEIAEADLKAGTRPSGSGFPDWNQSATSTVVVFTDKDGRQYEDGAAIYNAPANRETGIASSPQRKDRPFVHYADQAAQFASELSAAEVSDTGLNLDVLKARANRLDGSPLMPGDLFRWVYGPHGMSLVCRVVSRRLGLGQTSDVLQVVRERGAFPAPFASEPDEREPYVPVLPVDIANYRLWFLPPGFGGGRQITLLAEKPAAQNIATRVHLSAAGSAPWAEILTVANFAARGVLTLDSASGAATVRFSSSSLNLPAFQAQTAIGQKDDTLLLLIGDEVLSVGEITALGGGVLEVSVLRGRQGTTAAAHSVGDVAWLFYASELYTATHEEFYDVRVDGSYDASRATKRFKLQAVSADLTNDPQPADPGIAFQLPDLSETDSAGARTFRSPNAPTGFLRVGDLWYDTNDGNRLYRWNGSAWVDTSDGRIDDNFDLVTEMLEGLARDHAQHVAAANDQAAGLLEELSRRAAAIAAEAAARGAAITAEQTIRQAADDSLAANLLALTATVTTNNTTLTAAILLEQTTRATETAATARDVAALFATLNDQSAGLVRESEVQRSNTESLARDLAYLSAQLNDSVAAYLREIEVRTTATTALSTELTTQSAAIGANAAAITAESTTRATNDSALALDILDLTAAVGDMSAAVEILAAAYIVGGVAVSSFGFRLSAGNKVVGLRATAASGGSIVDLGEIVFEGCDQRSDNYAEDGSGYPTAGWKNGYDGIIRGYGARFRNVDIAGTLRAGSVIEAGVSITLSEAPLPPASNPTGYIIRLSAPGSPPTGYEVFTKWGSEGWAGPATSFPIDIDATGALTRELQYYARATGRLSSAISSTTYTELSGL